MKDVLTLLFLVIAYLVARFLLRRDMFTVLEVVHVEPTDRVGVRWVDFAPRPEHCMWRIAVRARVGVLPPRTEFAETYLGEGFDWVVERTGKMVDILVAFKLSELRDRLEKEKLFAEAVK